VTKVSIVGIRCHDAIAMELRVARHTDRLEEVVAFYRNRVALPELGRFTYDGVFLDLPGTGSHLEFTAGGDLPGPEPHPESLLVLYLETQQELDAIAARLSPSETTPANPYWQRTARAFADPDGFQLLLTLRASRAI
jgi:catechol 2,3-dioxygenase-like lactoylglutathione lyase family enzyme